MFKDVFSYILLIIFTLNYKTINGHPLSDDFADLVEKLSPSVVNVFTVQKPKPSNNQVPFDNIPPQFRDFFLKTSLLVFPLDLSSNNRHLKMNNLRRLVLDLLLIPVVI